MCIALFIETRKQKIMTPQACILAEITYHKYINDKKVHSYGMKKRGSGRKNNI